MNNFDEHERTLVQILQKLFLDNEVSTQLVFKGGTCLMFFYDLDRLSTDLDFDVRHGIKSLNTDKISEAVSAYLTIEDQREKYHTYFWNGKYQKGLHGIKVEVSKRDFPQKIVIKNFLGVNIATLAPEQMLAHKLAALSDRNKNRDLYDSNFMLEKNWNIDDEIIKARAGMETKEYLQTIIDKLEKNHDSIQKFILNDLGGMLNQARRDWVRKNLLDSLKRQLLIRTR
ncbi:MAG: nucleotidyl transferase AbiEii/AbiGii toxin family protein [Candidatus Nomurabacteria bacterium]|jgi:predicted nucleotidyltransferase component of viral defense system|nr:nucleotidyl transferase AbiEii/AbiGii toxin family protein [Candidatus Nomurabacteria bacterium]